VGVVGVSEKQKVLLRLPAVQATSVSNPNIDEILREQDRLMAEELKRARLEEALERARTSALRARAERVELESKLKTPTQGNPTPLNPELAGSVVAGFVRGLMASGLKEEEAYKALQHINPDVLALTLALASGNPTLALPLMVYRYQNPGVQSNPVKDAIDVSKTTTETIKTAFDMARETSKSEGSNVLAELIKQNTELMKMHYDMLARMMEKSAGSKSLWDVILEDDVKFRRFKELFYPQQQSTDPKILLEIEKLRDEREKWLAELRHKSEMNKLQTQHNQWVEMKRLELEERKLQASMEEARRKSEMLGKTLLSLAKALSEGEEGGGGEVGGAMGWRPVNVVAPEPYKFCPYCAVELVTEPDGVSRCPKCNARYRFQVTPGARPT
jgi:hypothetical protein